VAKTIKIDPITRLEGHGKIEIFLDDEGNVANACFQVPELRGFESFCVGRAAEEMPVITNRICGVCPEAHHVAAAKALDQVFGVEAPRAAHLLRELLYMAFVVTDHTTHFYALGGPDIIVGPDAPAAERNLLGVIAKLGLERGREILAARGRNHEILEWLGGRKVHPAAGVPGGWSTTLSEERRLRIVEFGKQNVAFAIQSIRLLQSLIEERAELAEMLRGETYTHRTYAMGTVDANNRLNFYDGTLRVITPDGREFSRFQARDYLAHIVERVEPWSYMKFPYLKAVGWRGFEEGAASGVYVAGPLARLNVSDSLATPLANQEFERYFDWFGKRRVDGRFQPVHNRMATHWARLIESLYASERMVELAQDPEITSDHIRNMPGQIAGFGVGQVEAPRGTLIHHYETDGRGILTRVNMIVGTTNNHAPMAMSIRRAAQAHIRAGRVVEDGMLNRIEMAFRLYDPCLSCATHSLPGQMPLVVRVTSATGAIVGEYRR
jgi:F420-non-reducing hydrogenase large subunit